MNSTAFPFSRPRAGAAFEAELREVLHDCAKRSVPALRRIYDLTAPGVLAVLLQLLGDRKRAEAALVDCYVRIWNEAGNFNPQRVEPRAWLLSIARHHAMERLRETQTETAEELDSALGFLHDALNYEDIAPEQRLLQLAWRSGRSPAEIARALQLPLRHVQQEIRHALSVLSESSK
ncbi:MAG: sigma factor [Pseudomonadota bacterium]